MGIILTEILDGPVENKGRQLKHAISTIIYLHFPIILEFIIQRHKLFSTFLILNATLTNWALVFLN